MVQYRVRDGVVARRENEKTFLFDELTARVLILNPTAALLFERCTEGNGLDDASIPGLLESRFDLAGDGTELATAVEEASRHLDLLAKAGFLECER
jgi:hypothetical protein